MNIERRYINVSSRAAMLVDFGGSCKILDISLYLFLLKSQKFELLIASAVVESSVNPRNMF